MPLRIGDSLPPLEGATSWYNFQGDLNSLELVGHPVLVHFWSVSCYLCKDSFPTLRTLISTYVPKGLKVIAVHMPRQEEDTNQELVAKCIKEFSISEPCAVDDEHKLKDAFKNNEGWVPAYFLFDREGKLRSRSAGEVGISALKVNILKQFSSS